MRTEPCRRFVLAHACQTKVPKRSANILPILKEGEDILMAAVGSYGSPTARMGIWRWLSGVLAADQLGQNMLISLFSSSHNTLASYTAMSVGRASWR